VSNLDLAAYSSLQVWQEPGHWGGDGHWVVGPIRIGDPTVQPKYVLVTMTVEAARELVARLADAVK